MSDQKRDLGRYAIAKEVVDQQLKTTEQNGLKVSEDEYEAMIERVAQSIIAVGHSKSAATS